MKIDTNAWGNYNPFSIKNTAPAQKAADIQKTAPTAQTQPVATTTAGDIQVNRAEKEFFVNMYPDSRQQIMQFHAYQRNGAMAAVSVGQLLDRRG